MVVSHPSDLAREILQAINLRDIITPPAETVIRLFQLIYHASISREESEFISFHMVFFNPSEAGQRQSKKQVRNSWHFIPLGSPEEMNLPNKHKIPLTL
ncbi:MAG TPA: hypothetical protein HPP97_08045 [Desulfuromonadales bacterium]|nr:hypothetical protein [Desulfuromonadales bacterium]